MRPDVYASDSYAAGQALGEDIRAGGGDGFMYLSLRHAGGTNVVAFRPTNVGNIVQTDHYEVEVQASSNQVEARRIEERV